MEFYKEIVLKAALKYGKIKRATLYKWKRKYRELKDKGLINNFNNCATNGRNEEVITRLYFHKRVHKCIKVK